MANYKTSWVQRLIDGVWQKTFAFSHAKTVYTDYANKKTLADKLSEIDTEIGSKANKTETTVNLLKPTLETTTFNGVTFINNGDGSISISGAVERGASAYTKSVLVPVNIGQTYRVIGKFIGVYKKDNATKILQNGVAGDTTPSTFTAIEDFVNVCMYVSHIDTIPQTGVISYPIITTNLNATNDDFVPYTGDTGSLNGDVADLRGDVDGIGITHKHSFFEPAVVNVTDNSYTYDFYLKDGYDFNDLIDGNGCGLAMVYINNGNSIKGSYGMLLLLSISPRLNAPDMIDMIYGRATGPGMKVTRVEYRTASDSKKGFRVIASSSSSTPADTFKALYTTVASWTNICNM